MSYNRLVLLWEKNNKFELLPNETGDVYDFISSHSLASGKCIGNLSACVIRQSLVSFIPPSLFDVCFDDWSLGLSLGLYGLIAKLNEPMSIYRKRKMGYWSGLSDLEQKQKILYRIDKYDLIFSGIYVDEFFLLRKSLMNKEEKNEKIEISRRKIIKQFIPPILCSILKYLCPPYFLK